MKARGRYRPHPRLRIASRPAVARRSDRTIFRNLPPTPIRADGLTEHRPSRRVRPPQAVPKGIGSVSLPTPRRGDALVTRNSAAADAGGMAEDPYKVLGVKRSTPGDELAKVINRKKLLYKTEPEKLKQMEDAYEQIVRASSPPGSAVTCPGCPSRLARTISRLRSSDLGRRYLRKRRSRTRR